jgi:subtilase family serine protease
MTKTKLFALAAVFSLVFATSAMVVAQDNRTPEPAASTGQAAEPLAVAPSPQSGHFIHPGGVLTLDIASRDGKTPLVMAKPEAFPVGSSSEGSQAVTLFQEPETPQSMGCIYVSSPSSTGCIPNYNSGSGGPSSAGYGAIAVVDAYDSPTAASDLATFDSYWGLAAPPSFTVLYATGNGSCTTVPQPPSGLTAWQVETALDTQWAHVFAPKAAIILVETCTQSLSDLIYGDEVAFTYIAANFKTTGGQVSNSWQWPEPGGSAQYSDDLLFTDHVYTSGQGWKPNILAFASSGDSGFEGFSQAGYPSANPWVVSAGGTSIWRNQANSYFYNEQCWSGSGGGESAVETWSNTYTGGNTGPWADFQYPMFAESSRRTPDFSFNADPASGVLIYCSEPEGCTTPGYYSIGGTSVSSPSLASIVNRANNRMGSVHLNAVTGNNGYFATAENNLAYATLPAYSSHTAFYDVKLGSNGQSAVAGWDYCTGLGASRGTAGK